MKIRDKEDYQLWSYFLKHLDGFSSINAEKIVKVKRALREYAHRPVDERRIVRDDGIDGCVVLFPLPDRIKTSEGASEYFMHTEYRECAPSMYDCTGQAFTSWFKIINRQGRFWAYHSICFDV